LSIAEPRRIARLNTDAGNGVANLLLPRLTLRLCFNATCPRIRISFTFPFRDRGGAEHTDSDDHANGGNDQFLHFTISSAGSGLCLKKGRFLEQ
jgi:hypothetical protein